MRIPLVMIVVVLGTARGLAQEVAGIRLPVVATIGGHELQLRGAELLRWKWVVRIYVAALYLPVSAAAGDPLADVPKRITFHYQRGFTAAQLAEATTRTIGRGLDAAALAAIEPELAAFNRLYRQVESGDVMTIDYLPDGGTVLGLNGATLGSVPGSAFARALFAIWLGEHAVDDDLKSALLGSR